MKTNGAFSRPVGEVSQYLGKQKIAVFRRESPHETQLT